MVIGALVGVPALLAVLAAWTRPRLARMAAAVLVVAMLGPLAVLDGLHVFTRVTTTYRDAMIDAGPLVNGRVTGGLSYAMQLHNSSRAVLASAVSASGWGQGLPLDEATEQYEQTLVRLFAEGRASYLYAYAGADALDRWTPLGFRLVETLPIILPKGRQMGLWIYDP